MISVVIITLNEQAHIRRTISALSDQRINQIIIVDSNSTDSTPLIISSINDPRIEFYSYNNPPFTPARGRFEGAKHIDSTNKYILFLDGDMEYSGDFTDIAIKALEDDPYLAGIMGQRKDVYYLKNKIVGKKDNYYSKNETQPSGCLFLKLYDYFQTPGFKKELICDEEGFLYSFYKMKKKYFIRVNNLMFVHHTEAKMSKEQIFIRLKNGRLTGLGVTLFYCLPRPYLLYDFIIRRRNEFLAGVLLFLLFLPKNIITCLGIVVLFCYLIIRFKFNVRLFFNFSVYFIFMAVGFIQAILYELKKIFKHV